MTPQLPKCGPVVEVSDDSFFVYHEKKVYKIVRTPRLQAVGLADWLAFDVCDHTETSTVTSIPRRWDSVVGPDGHVWLTINAVYRDPDEFPGDCPNQPWSFELEYLQDPKRRMQYERDVYPNVMYRVRVRVLPIFNKPDRRNFEIIDIEDESPFEQQKLMVFAPWYCEALAALPDMRDGAIPLVSRGGQRGNEQAGFRGVVYKRATNFNSNFPDKLYVWSPQTGSIRIDDDAQFEVGDWITFYVANGKHPKAIKSKRMIRALKETDKEIRHNDELVTILSECQVPKNADSLPSFEIDDDFVGMVRVSSKVLESRLSQLGLVLQDVVGKYIRMWLSTRRDSQSDGQISWAFVKLDSELFVEGRNSELQEADLIAL